MMEDLQQKTRRVKFNGREMLFSAGIYLQMPKDDFLSKKKKKRPGSSACSMKAYVKGGSKIFRRR
jgi:hypothetical protein